MTIDDIARVAHEVNRAYCTALGDTSQKPWLEAEDWQRKSAIDGVKFRMSCPEAPVSAQHDSWLKAKEADGWVYGETKDAEAKTHPCMVPYEELPAEQKAKDYLFQAVADSLIKFL